MNSEGEDEAEVTFLEHGTVEIEKSQSSPQSQSGEAYGSTSFRLIVVAEKVYTTTTP